MVAVGDKILVKAPKAQMPGGSWPKWDGKVATVTSVRSDKAVYARHPDTGEEGYIAKEYYTLVKEDTVNDLRRLVDSLRRQGYTISVEVTPPVETITL